MGISLRRKASGPVPGKGETEGPKPQPPAGDGRERLTANEWARRHRLNEVAAERAAMRAGRWHDLFTEEEFLELIRRADV